jgi:hypothetical protein
MRRQEQQAQDLQCRPQALVQHPYQQQRRQQQ